jgi:HK97 family phage major capsid protein
MSENVDLLVENPEEVAARIASHLGKLSRASLRDELVYTPFGKDSYYRDLIASHSNREGEAFARLQRHGEQMDKLRAARDASTFRRFASAPFEYRVTPDRTDGTGGYLSPPAWLNELFVTANRTGRVLSGLIPKFPLPQGVSSIHVPIISTGTANQRAEDDSAVTDQDFTDTASESSVVTLTGQVDIALQLLEQSPQGAHLDWAIFTDMAEAYDEDLETELLSGTGSPALLGVLNIPKIGAEVEYTEGSPTASKMWSHLSQVPARIGKARRKPPQCWLMTTSRWAWFQGSEDTAERPFGLSTRFYLGNDDATPDPIGGLMGWPVFLADAIPTNLGNGKQDVIAALRPHDQILCESTPDTLVAREPASGSLGVRLQTHCRAAALTARRPAGIGTLTGTGMTIQAGY